MKQAVNQRVALLKVKLDENSFTRFVKRVATCWKEDDATDRAGAVAFNAFLSIFPLILGIFALVGFIFTDVEVRDTVSDALLRALPGSTEAIDANLDEIIKLRDIGAVLGVVGLLWSGSNMFTAIRRASNRAWGLKKERYFVSGKLRDVAMVLGTGALILMSLAAIELVAVIGTTGRPLLHAFILLGSRLAGFLMALLAFLLIYKWVPNMKTLWRYTWPGALLAVALFQASTYVFVFYLTHFADFQTVYGPIGSFIALMIWIYICSFVLILGAEVNSGLYWERVESSSERGPVI